MRFNCICGKALEVAEDLAGKKVRCPFCRAVVQVPSPAIPSPPVARVHVQREAPRRAVRRVWLWAVVVGSAVVVLSAVGGIVALSLARLGPSQAEVVGPGRPTVGNPPLGAWSGRAAGTRRSRTSEGLSALSAIQRAERVYKTPGGSFLPVAAGDIGNDVAHGGLGLDFSKATYFRNECFSVALDETCGFVATCDGTAGASAPRKADVDTCIIQMRANGQRRYSFDGGTTYSNWE